MSLRKNISGLAPVGDKYSIFWVKYQIWENHSFGGPKAWSVFVYNWFWDVLASEMQF